VAVPAQMRQGEPSPGADAAGGGTAEAAIHSRSASVAQAVSVSAHCSACRTAAAVKGAFRSGPRTAACLKPEYLTGEHCVRVAQLLHGRQQLGVR
jgi:hypothetical protein